MSTVSISEGNKMIAEFMGCYGSEHWAGGEAVYRYGFKDTHITERWHESNFDERTPYHSSWDWLHPVWDKFKLLTAPVGLEGVLLNYIARLAQDLAHETIDVFHRNLVTAITWYNSLTPKQQ